MASHRLPKQKKKREESRNESEETRLEGSDGLFLNGNTNEERLHVDESVHVDNGNPMMSNNNNNDNSSSTLNTLRRRSKSRPITHHFGITTWDSGYEDEEAAIPDMQDSPFDILSELQRNWEREVTRGGGRPNSMDLQERSLDRACVDFLIRQVNALPESQRLAKLDIELCRIQSLQVVPVPELLVQFIALNFSSLKELHLHLSHFDPLFHPDTENRFLPLIFRMPKLTTLCLESYNITNSLLLDYFRATPSLKALTLLNCALDTDSFRFLSRANSTLQVLAINSAIQDNIAAKLLTDIDWTNSTVRSLDLARNELTHLTFQPLAAFLTQHKSLKLLKLDENDIFNVAPQNEHFLAFVHAVANHKTLEGLHLSRCSLSDETLSPLLTGLVHNRALETLDVSWNFGIRHGDWVRSIPHLTALRKFHVRGSLSRGSSRTERKMFRDAMQRNTSLVRCDLSNTGLEGLGCAQFLIRNFFMWKIQRLLPSEPILGCWTPLLARLSSMEGGAGLDPIFLFLRTKTVELANLNELVGTRRKRRGSPSFQS